MKFSVLLLTLTSLFAFSLMSLSDALPEEEAGIRKAVLDYIEGWYQGDAERMNAALHPDLAKRRIVALPAGKGGSVLDSVSKASMVEYTRAGFGKTDDLEGKKIEITVLDQSRSLASAKCRTVDFLDYIHLAKVDGRWVIVNVLWESLRPPK